MDGMGMRMREEQFRNAPSGMRGKLGRLQHKNVFTGRHSFKKFENLI